MDDARSQRTRRLRRTATALAIVGGVLVLVGGVGLALDGDDDAASPAAARAGDARPSATESTESTEATTPVPTTVPLATRVSTFFADWANALRAGDEAYLVARLHPAVLERYGEAACLATLAPIQLPQASAEVLSTEPATAPWSWTTDGQTTAVADALGLRLRRTEDGSTVTESDAHIALVGDEVRWFTDCGTPR